MDGGNPVGRKKRLAKLFDLTGLERGSGETFRWTGEYTHQLNEAHTLDTRLNVFETFRPRIPERYQSPDMLFLGNIDPELQWDVLKQVKRPKLVACDTMNFWIERKREALGVLERATRERDAQLIHAAEGTTVEVEADDGGLCVTLCTPTRAYEPTPLALRGRHQVANAMVAVRLLEELDRLGVAVSAHAIRRGLSEVRWPARLDLLAIGDRRVLVDAAHNPAGVAALAAYLAEVHPGGVPIVFGAARDKPYETMMGLLAPHATRLICTTFASPRAETAEWLAACARRLVGALAVECVPDPVVAVRRAWADAPLVCVAGSIFLAGEILAWLRPDPPKT